MTRPNGMLLTLARRGAERRLDEIASEVSQLQAWFPELAPTAAPKVTRRVRRRKPRRPARRLRGARRGELMGLVRTFYNTKAKKISDEARRIVKVAKAHGISTTHESVEQTIYRVRRVDAASPSRRSMTEAEA